MTPECRAAFINAQTQMMVNEREAMLAANRERERNGLTLAYSEEQFDAFNKRWEPVLGYNELILFFNA